MALASRGLGSRSAPVPPNTPAWTGRKAWGEVFDGVITAQPAPSCEAAGVAPDEVADLLGPEAYVQVSGWARRASSRTSSNLTDAT